MAVTALTANQITTGKGDFGGSPVAFIPNPTLGPITWATAFTGAWILGDGPEEGFAFSETADEKEKNGWSGSYGSIYSKFADTVTGSLISSLDPDVLRFIWGAAQVHETADLLRVGHVARIPTAGTLIFRSKTDDGRRRWEVYRNAQVSLEVEYTLASEDLVAYSFTAKAMSLAGLASDEYPHETLLDPLPAAEEDD